MVTFLPYAFNNVFLQLNVMRKDLITLSQNSNVNTDFIKGSGVFEIISTGVISPKSYATQGKVSLEIGPGEVNIACQVPFAVHYIIIIIFNKRI